jgi:hypothetical protein
MERPSANWSLEIITVADGMMTQTMNALLCVVYAGSLPCAREATSVPASLNTANGGK